MSDSSRDIPSAPRSDEIAEARTHLAAASAQLKAYRAKLPANSPLHGEAFKLAALIGEIEAFIKSSDVK